MNEALSTWELFILRHRQPANLVVHFISWLMFFGGPLLVLLTGNVWWLGLFFLSGAVGAAGHYVFKDGGVSVHEATSNIKVPLYITRIFVALLRGDYWSQVDEAAIKARGLGLLTRSVSRF